MTQHVNIINTVDQYNRMYGVETRHPLITVVDVKDYEPVELSVVARYGLYAVFFKQGKGCTLRYGREIYDYQAGSIVCFAPGQTVSVEYLPGETMNWKALLFHPDLLFDTTLAGRMAQYTYFGYAQREALHVSDEERRILEDTLGHISNEMSHAVDKHSQQLLAVYVQLILDYCLRFYDRQFVTRHKENSKLIRRFEQLVDDFLDSDRPLAEGRPSVAWCAGELCLSPNYFGDLVRKELGGSAKDFITRKVIERAKRDLRSDELSIGQIADRLGFSSVSHFTRLFKSQTGQTPTEYRAGA
ncbi:MAG: helix-turn-helix transcriptional regulator [Clostridium sp.]|nr:helix-turn-helix transcriptional regulator [Clostridium sp.]